MRPNKCEKHQNYKYIHFCPFCKAVADRDQLAQERDRYKAALENINSWLGRMKDLHWDDPEYAPRFKKTFEENQQLLSRPITSDRQEGVK